MKNLFLILRKTYAGVKVSHPRYSKYSLLFVTLFFIADTFAQISNNYLDYTNGTHSYVCVTASENGTATFTAPSGTVFTTVYFGSYGTPNGSCNAFSTSSCNASSSQSVVEGYLLGKSGTINIPANNSVFTDPCVGTVKRLYAQVFYTEPICKGSSPGTISGTTPSGVLFPGYSWEKNTIGPTATFTPTGVTSKDYNPGNLTQTTWFRRKVSGLWLSDNYSPVLQITVVPPPVASASSTATCVGGSTGSITGSGSGGSTPYTYSIDGITFQSSNTFSGLSAGNYTLYVKSSSGCVASTPVSVSEYAASTGNQNAAGTNVWTGHAYDGTNFGTYVGTFSQSEIFDQNFGGTNTCFPVTSSAGASSIYTETFSVRYRMNSTRNGLYVVDLGSDDGSRLTVDGTLVYNNWNDQGLNINSRILMNLNGNSSLNYEFYENGGGNEVAFQNLTLVLANTLSANTSQTICLGSTGSSISGDVYGTLPAGIALSGTGYQWAYSTTAGGTKINISGATAATFTPNTSTAPFNVAGTYYLYRKAIVTSTNNHGLASYSATNESNAATVTVKPVPSATISYAGSPYCTSAGTATVSLSGTAGGTFSSDAALKINASTGSIDLATSSQGSHTVTYTVAAANGCSAFSTTTNIAITLQPYASGFYPANPYCSNIGTLIPTGSQQGKMGTLSSAPAGLSINSATGIINVTSSTPGSYTVTYSVPAYGGCGAYSASAPVIISTAPSATIKYNGSPYCFGSGTASVSRTGTSGGTFSSTAGLNINSSTGDVDLVHSTPATYTVTYTIAAANGCATYTTTTNITITPKVSSLVFTAGASSVRCQGTGTVVYTATVNNSTGITYSLDATSLAAGNSINSSTGAVTFVAGWIGTSSIKAVASGCTPLNTTHTVTTSATPSANVNTTYTCIDGSSATITVTGNTGISPFSYSLNSGTFQSSGAFAGLAAGNYSIQVKSNDGCIYSTSAAINPYPNSTGDQSVARTDSWTGHMYNGKIFDQYKGYFSETETFDETFGGPATCFPITSTVPGSSIYTDQFSVKFKMNSTKKGLYVVDLGSDDGSRLTVDGDLIFNDWTDHAFAGRPRVLMNLVGNSSLVYEFYESGGDNRVVFNNLTLVLENNLSANLSQSICMGNSGVAIGGDAYGTLPSGVSKYGTTGYQWVYSTTVGGTTINIPGATDATFTPNTSTAPFNAPGTYYVYRNAILSSTNNTGKNPYVARNLSNAAIVTINAVPSATISYANSPFCNTSSLPEKVTLAGTSGGIFSAAGLLINSATGDIVPNANGVGLYAVNYSIAAAGGCSSFSTSTKIYIGTAGTWSGKINNDWENTGNWICGIIPNSGIDATIPKQVSNFPLIVTQSAEAKNLNIATGASLIISGSIKIAGAINNFGNFNLENGTLEMIGSGAQTIAGSLFENKSIKDLIVSNTGSGLSVSSTSGDTLKITGQLSFGNANSILNTGDNITLVSNYFGTAHIGKIGNNNAVNGKVTVERYINTGTGGGQHGKSWQFLSAPTNGQSVKESWMENGNTPGNFGTMISAPAGTAAGFDMYSVAPSIKYFDDVLNNWKSVSSANDQIANTQGYMVFVRGDRSITATNQAANSTVLRTKGTLNIGDLPAILVKANKFQSIGNPYASPIDFALINKDTTIDDAFYIYDPYLYGSYGVGGYQTLSSVNNWKPVPGGTSAYPTTVLSSIIQSGQAFFVHSHNTTKDGSISFTENSKSSASRPGHSNRVATNETTNTKQFLRASLFTSSGLMADGNVVAFDKSYRDNIDGNDALKITNSGENFAIKSSGKLLTIEAKSQVDESDTIYYNISNLSRTTYQLAFAPENMESAGLQAFLIDKFLNTETPVSLSDSTFINVAITSNGGSSAADRFKVVFRQMSALPVTITSITATNKESKNFIQWTVENESSIGRYEVEKSADGNHFNQIAIVNANNNKSGNYSATDNDVNSSINYYRIKIISVDGKINYTQIVKVISSIKNAAISVFPNPIENGIINLQLNNQPAGIYKIKLYNSIGQVIVSESFNHTEGSSKQTIKGKNLSKGLYQLEVIQPGGNVNIIKILN